MEDTNADDSKVLEIISYEAINMFYNKLVCHEDIEKLKNIVKDSVQQAWGKSNILDEVFKYFYIPNPQVSSISSSLKLQKHTKEEWQKQIEQAIIYCEREGMVMDVMVNDELINICSVISKILSGLEENLVLLGISGVGRRSALKIISALLSAKLIVPSSETQSQLYIELKKAGITKLDEAKQLVNDLKLKADEQQNKLSEKQEKANSALDMISNTMKNANSKKELMENLKQQTEDENVQILRR
ncbi:unnamed protein product [Brassicogethes aeneus]|uniref:Uncharacterized protein n=1 Tax=Brassicogethes aeneus TaxID=1431903 RepID=A0A9P0B088_BRAAE|nr:unnamed protein product [Brassicogethes aeneus]